MAFSLAPVIRQRYLDANGEPLAGGKLYTYQANTVTPQATYTDSTGATPNANPVILDANGEANIWLDVSLSYKFILKDSNDVDQFTVDNVIGLITNNAVSAAALQDSSVTTAKLADDSVTSAKLADDASIDANRAVTTNHIRDVSVTRAKLAVGAVPLNSQPSVKTNTYAVLTTDDVILVDGTTNAFTTTLPTAVGCQGRRYKFLRIDNTLSRKITVATTSSQTLGPNGATTFKLATKEMAEWESDGSNWILVNRWIDGSTITFTPTVANWNTNMTLTGRWERRHNCARVIINIACSGAPAGGGIGLSINIPTDMVIDTADRPSNSSYQSSGIALDAATASYPLNVIYSSTTAITPYVYNSAATYSVYAQITSTLPFTFGSGDSLYVEFEVPIVDWEG